MKPSPTVYSLALALLIVACGKRAEQSTAPEAEPKHEEGHVALLADGIRNGGIEIATAGPAQIRDLLPLYGTVRANAERVREVSARYPGIVRGVVHKVGDTVREGDVLASVESNESLRTYEIVAPISGVVTARNANPGEYSGDKPLFTVTDLSTVWVELALFPRDLPKVHLGQAVTIKSADAGLMGVGKVAYVAPLGQTTSQTLTARVLVDNAEGRWAPGLYVTGEVTLSASEVPVAVKSSALQTVEGKTVVFLRTDDGFQAASVAIGRSDDTLTEIQSGLDAGASYAAINSFVLKSELGKSEAGHED